MSLITSLVAMALISTSPPASPLTADGCSFGETYSFSKAECRIRLHNGGDHAVSVEMSGQNAGDTVSPSRLTVPANGSAEATVELDVGNSVGRLNRGFRIHSEKSDVYALAQGFAISALDNPTASISFGSIDLTPKPAEQTIKLSSHDAATFRIVSINELPQGIDAVIGADASTLRVSIKPEAPLGIVEGDIKLSVDTPRQHEAWVHVTADIRGDVTTENNPYWFGSIPAGTARQVLIPLSSRNGRDFRIGKIDLDMVKGKVDVVPCEKKAVYCKSVRVVFDDSQRAALTRAKLDIELPDSNRHMLVRIWGFLQNSAPSTARATNLPELAQEDISAPWTEGIVDSVNAPVYAVPIDDPLDVTGGPAPTSEPPPGTGPLLKWGIAGETGAYGYQIFRAENAAGPFVLQNPDLIRVHAKEYSNIPYFWRDGQTKKGATYWYYIGVVYKDGHKQALSAPLSKVAN